MTHTTTTHQIRPRLAALIADARDALDYAARVAAMDGARECSAELDMLAAATGAILAASTLTSDAAPADGARADLVTAPNSARGPRKYRPVGPVDGARADLATAPNSTRGPRKYRPVGSAD